MMIRLNIAHEAMNSNGIVLVTVNLCDLSLCSVFRGSRERSRRWSAAVAARMSGVGEVEMEEGRGRRRARRSNGERIMRGMDAEGVEVDDSLLEACSRLDMVWAVCVE